MHIRRSHPHLDLIPPLSKATATLNLANRTTLAATSSPALVVYPRSIVTISNLGGATCMATMKRKNEGKSMFLKEYLLDHPDSGKSVIDEA